MKAKHTLIFCFLFLAVAVCFAQEEEASKTFTMIYTPGKKWNHQIPFNEQPYFAEHSQHLQKLRKEGKIKLGGRYSDKGFMLLYAKDSMEADSIVKKDLSVRHQIFEVELFEFKPFYYGCVEKENKQNN